ELGGVREAERRVARLELGAGLEIAEDLVVQRIGRHAVPGAREQRRRRSGNDGVDALAHPAVFLAHLGEGGEQLLLAIGLADLAALAVGDGGLHGLALLGGEDLVGFERRSLGGFLCRGFGGDGHADAPYHLSWVIWTMLPTPSSICAMVEAVTSV